jgi:ankyrin repeat protein
MYDANALAEVIKRNNFEEAKQRIDQGEKLPKDLAAYDRGQVYDVLARERAFELINSFVKDGTIEADIYDYDKFEGTIFESLLKNLRNKETDLEFLRSFLQQTDSLNDALQDQTLLGLAFMNSAPIEVIQVLIDAGCDVNYKNNKEESFLYKIIQAYRIKEEIGLTYLEFLLQKGLDPNARNIVRETPLHLAISENKEEYIVKLLQQGADPNQQGKDGETAFYTALVHQVSDVEMYNLIKAYAPADFDIVNKNDEALLLGIVRMPRSPEKEIQLLQTLIQDGADIYQTSPYYGQDKSALDWISERDADILQGVLETGVVELERKDEAGNTLLHKICALNANYEEKVAKQIYRKVKILIDHGADVNNTNDLDQAPIDLAAQDNLKTKTVELLLKNKA